VRRLATVAALLLLTGCAALRGERPQIEKRFARQLDANDEASTIALAVTSAEISTGTDRVPITQLGDRAQPALIEETKVKPPVLIGASMSRASL
jgi:hypothetical protein